jgi:putative membrane protein
MKKDKKSMFEFENKERIILRDYLALERTRLANERTLFAYLRTSLYLVLGGIAFLQLRDFEHIKWLGYLSIGLSVVFLVAGIFTYYKLKNKLRKYYSDTSINPGESE